MTRDAQVRRHCFRIAAAAHLLVLVAAARSHAEAVSLFNGSDLAGWTQVTGDAAYTVEPGEPGEPPAIVGTSVANDSVNSFLATDATYGNFVLEYEFKVDADLNSGVQVRSFLDNSSLVRGYQIEIDPSQRAWSGGLYEERGRGWLDDLGDNAAAREAFVPGEWNHIRVVADGNRVRSWINGVPAADFTETDGEVPSAGFIALQVHTVGTAGLEVRWREISLETLGEAVQGDFDASGQVEQADLDLALQNWGRPATSLPATWVRWQPADGIVDQAELDAVLQNWGSTGGGGTGGGFIRAVPEPTTWGTMGLAIGIKSIRRSSCALA